jgi:hypothetical protein
LGRTAHRRGDRDADLTRMSELGMHHIADDLSETWIEDWAGAGVAEIEAYLGKHAAFLSYLETEEV